MKDLFDILQKETEQDVSELKIPPKFVPTTYHDVEFGLQNDNRWRTYNECLAALRQRGYDRHPRSSEVFTLLADSLEGKITDDLEGVAQNIRASWWEWTSLAWERKGNLLIAYLDLEGLVWDKENLTYIKKDFHCTSEHHFDIADKISQKWTPLREFSDDFIEFHYGRTFGDLPQQIKQSAQVWLPLDGFLWHAGRYDGRYDINCCSYSDRASRGVKVKPAQNCRGKWKSR